MEKLYLDYDVVKREIVVVGKMVQVSNHNLQVRLAPKGEIKNGLGKVKNRRRGNF